MQFNSFDYLFFFLPIVVTLYAIFRTSIISKYIVFAAKPPNARAATANSLQRTLDRSKEEARTRPIDMQIRRISVGVLGEIKWADTLVPPRFSIDQSGDPCVTCVPGAEIN